MKLSILLTLIIVVVLMLGALRPVCVALNNDEFAHFNVPPHSSMLPTMIQPAALLLGWVVFLITPAFVARAVWRRTS